jgi:DNA-binding transcriptional MerR regulator
LEKFLGAISIETLEEGIGQKIKAGLLSLCVNFLSEKRLDEILLRAKEKAQSQARAQGLQLSEVEKLVEKFSINKSKAEKKALIKSLLKQAPEKVLKDADKKVQGLLKKEKNNLKEEVLNEFTLKDLSNRVKENTVSGEGEAVVDGVKVALSGTAVKDFTLTGAEASQLISSISSAFFWTSIVSLISGIIVGVVVPILVKKIAEAIVQ